MSAIDLAKANRARLTSVHAHVPMPLVPLVPEQYLEASTWDKVDTETRRWAERQVEKLVEKAWCTCVRDDGHWRSSTANRPDGPLQARRSHCGRTHGRRGFSKFFLGSVAERVIATAPCPVMTVRGK